MSSWIRIFNCCEKVNYIKNKEVDMNLFDSRIKDKENNKEDNNSKIDNNNNNNNLEVQNSLYQSNSELYNFLKNNISSYKPNISLNNISKLNLDKTQKFINSPEEFKNISNKVINNNIINNNIIKITNNNNFLNMNQKDLGYISFCNQSNLYKSSISIKPKNLLLMGHLFFNKNIKITPNGLENSLRNKNDFPIYFGTEATVDKNGLSYNDYIVNYNPKKLIKKKKTDNDNKDNSDNKDNNDDNKDNSDDNKDNSNDNAIKEKENIKGGRLFQIIYDRNKNEYILNFIHNSLILYYRINNPIYFDYDKEYYFILGNVFISIIIKKIGDKKNISIKVETEDQKAEKESFDNEKKLIIGRGNTCDIQIDKPCISKIHSIIEYDNTLNRYYYRDNNSTNGSTLLIREDDSVAIKGSMYFKLEDTSFVIKEV